MAYNAGDVEAKLTLDRDPFTEGLKLARRQAQEFERKTYEAKLRITIAGEAQLKALTERLNNLGRRVFTPTVRVNSTGVLPTITQINTRLTALGNRKVRPTVTVTTNTASVVATNAALNHVARTRTAQIKPQVNRSFLLTMSSSFAALGKAFSGTLSVVGKALASTGVIGAKAFKLMADGGLQATAGVLGLVVKLGAVSVALGAMGALALAVFGAITFAVGTLTTLLVALPALIAAIGIPIAALVIGWNGVTEAAKVLSDEIKHLQESVQKTLHDTMLPGFERLQVVFPILEEGLNNVARETGNWFTELTKVFTSTENLEKIKEVFAGVLIFLEAMEDPLQHILQSFLDIAATKSILSSWGDILGGITERIARMFDEMLRTGQLEAALRELQPLLFQLTDMFTGFASSSLDFFTEAAPGVAELFKGIQAAVENIDFVALGHAWGEIAGAIGEIFADIPPETWQDIVLSFQRLADVLRDPEVQRGIRYLFEGIDDLIGLFDRAVLAIGKFIDWFRRADAKVVETTERIDDFMELGNAWGVFWDFLGGKAWDTLNGVAATTGVRLHEANMSFDGFIQNARNAWNRFWDDIWNKLRSVGDSITRSFNDFRTTWIVPIVQFVQAFINEFNKLRDAAFRPVKWVIDVVYNGGIVPVWNGIAGVFGMPKLGPARFAEGGVIPGYAPGVDSVPAKIAGGGMAMLSPGEGILVPEAVRGLGKEFIDWANTHFSQGRVNTAGKGHYAAGGIVESNWSQIGDIFTNPVAGVRKAFSSVLNSVAPGSGMLRDAMQKIPSMVVGAITEKAKSFLSAIMSGGGGGGAQRWMPVILQSLGIVGQPLSYAGITARRMNQESGGNPTAVNRTDVNWQRGTPSVGLMQVIGPTYSAYRHPGFDVGPYMYGTSINPLANLLASERYALSRYGSLPAAYNRAGGYDNGGILPPGWTAAYNGTGQNEYVVPGGVGRGVSTRLDNDTIERLAGAIAKLSGGGTSVTVNSNGGSDSGVRRLTEDLIFAIRHAQKSVRV